VVAAALRGAGPAATQVAVQVREKDLSARALVELARQLRAVTSAAGAALFVNDRVDVALAVEADGYISPLERCQYEMRVALPPTSGIAVSTHDCSEVELATRAGADFVVFWSCVRHAVKACLRTAQRPRALARACSCSIPVIALGGIDNSNADHVFVSALTESLRSVP